MSTPAPSALCKHCGSEIPQGASGTGEFCCRGCQAAYGLINGMGLTAYYQRRCIDPDVKPLRPEDNEGGVLDFAAHVVPGTEDGTSSLHLMVEGLHCAACVWLIESLLRRQPGVVNARVNMTTRRLTLVWRTAETEVNTIVEPVLRIGYRLVPYDPTRLGAQTALHEKELLRCMAVAGFAAGNIMLLSVSVWAGVDMGPNTRDLFHWISALIAFPTIAYAVRPFARSAFSALRAGRTNMDVPITLAVCLAAVMSLWETARSGHHAYFDASVMLLFFLLIGRYLDSRARGRARSAAEHLLSLGAQAVTVLRADGTRALLPPGQLEPGMTVLVAAGERIGVDGTVSDGVSDLDTSLITGETVPQPTRPGDGVFAGTLNLSGPLRVRVGAVGEGTLLAEIVRMMEVAEQGRAKYVALADRVARLYSPVVHLMAGITFLGWTMFGGMDWQPALLIAVAVLIITCPCALALAVPVVQVIATGRLLRRGILLKTATALERLVDVDTVVFDKTGTLTLGHAELDRAGPDGSGVPWTEADLRLAAGMAVSSRHPLARAIARATMAPVVDGVAEVPGQGLRAVVAGAEVRLGSRAFCGAGDVAVAPAAGPELWLARAGRPPVRFTFTDPAREDAAEVVATLRRRGIRVVLLSGDREPAVRAVAERLGINDWTAACTPEAKCARLADLRREGRKVLMVGDGLNDAPALAAADVSMSPSTAVDVSQTAADVVFQGHKLAPVAEVLTVARKANALVRQNFALSVGYNVFTVPLAVAGFVTPLIAALAMSTSSVVVIANALRLTGRGPTAGEG
ncbi:heavy metal translocating P-type ATPase metal-binding domain-containing protein [Novispirillum sp. DQ9]|uniref:heavy metal translocating P-type ATPase metal-binding domain-containing protein n=1 Tax=Novispirillum sp. DQ9 TaxID=3398612 RepID=UPI003C7B53DE